MKHTYMVLPFLPLPLEKKELFIRGEKKINVILRGTEGEIIIIIISPKKFRVLVSPPGGEGGDVFCC